MHRSAIWLVGWWLLCTAALGQTPVASPEASVRQLWQLLDYVAVDYHGAVANGAVASESEYAEMREFADNAVKGLQALPPNPAKDELVASAAQLRQAVLRHADAGEVAALAQRTSTSLLAAYPIPVAPKALPDLQRGAALYQSQCASCHGPQGHGDGPLAASLKPSPIAFSDPERAGSRSLLALYQTVSQGVAGTSMAGFATLPDSDRWALAFYVGTLSHSDAMRLHGGQLWQGDASARAKFPDLAALTTSSESVLATTVPADVARDLTAYLRSHPQALQADQPGSLDLARRRLHESMVALRQGNRSEATRLGLSAYLDGFEPLEPALGARNKALLTRVEKTMLEYRAAVADGHVDRAGASADKLDRLFMQVNAELGAANADPMTTFVGSLTILLREGVEALLVIVGMVAFLKKAERPDVLRYVHAGWVAALAAGALTWAIATYVVGISGASREVTEGVSSLFAAVVLLGVGLWMHQKSTAGRWQAYLKDKLSAAMSRRSAWALFALAFIAVYREVFETVLFYSALSADGNGVALLAGLFGGITILAAIAWLLLRSSARMPIGKFFAASSILVAVLAVVLAGKGVAGLQEAGWLNVTPIAWPHIKALGMFPTAETTIAQFLALLISLAGFGFNTFTARRPAPA